MRKYSYNLKGQIFKDGHTMFTKDVARELNERVLLEIEKKEIVEQYENELRDKEALIVEFGTRIIASESQMSFKQLENSRKYIEYHITDK